MYAIREPNVYIPGAYHDRSNTIIARPRLDTLASGQDVDGIPVAGFAVCHAAAQNGLLVFVCQTALQPSRTPHFVAGPHHE